MPYPVPPDPISGGGGGGGPVTIADGANVTQGTSTDANTVASVMGRLTKIRDLLNATLTVAGTITEANSASIKTDLDTVVTNTNKIPTSPAQEGGNLATIVTNTTSIATAANQTTGNTNTSNIATGIGGVADAAYTSGSGSTIAVLKGVFTRLANIVTIAFDNTSKLQTSLYGKNSAAGDTPLLLNSDGSAQVDLRKIAGATLSASNPVIIESSIQNAARNAQAFSASTGKIATQTNANVVMAASLFNPANSGKTFIVYSIKVIVQASTASVSINNTTTDPAYSNVITPINLKIGGAASVASVTSSPNNNTTSSTTGGTTFDNGAANANVVNEQLTNGAAIVLPSGSSANGIEIFNTIGTAGNTITFAFRWLEF